MREAMWPSGLVRCPTFGLLPLSTPQYNDICWKGAPDQFKVGTALRSLPPPVASRSAVCGRRALTHLFARSPNMPRPLPTHPPTYLHAHAAHARADPFAPVHRTWTSTSRQRSSFSAVAPS